MESKNYFQGTKQILDQNIHKYLYALIKFLFFGGNTNRDTRIKDKLQKINNKLKIKIELKRGKVICDINQFKVILNFIKSQNLLFASEIIENIIIRALSFACQANSSEFFGKYVYNNLKELRENKVKLLLKWFEKSPTLMTFKNGKQYVLDKILENDIDIFKDDSDSNKSRYNDFEKRNFFVQLLINMRLLTNVFNKTNCKKNTNANLEMSMTKLYSKTSVYINLSCLFYPEELNRIKKDYVLPLATSILISAYIYKQNRCSPLITYSDNSENLSKVKFTYELSEAAINDCYLSIIIKPIRIEPKIEYVELNKNMFGIEGIIELHKTMVFNKNLKKLSIKSCGIKSNYLKTFSENIQYLENSNIEELDITSNYLKSDSDIYLSKLISILTGLKILVLSFNNLKSGLSPFFVALKNLYRQNKSNLEALILIRCELDDISFYELGELLKSKFCKLKYLCLNENIIPSDIKFFNSLKKNRSLKELYLCGCGISSYNAEEINKIISNTYLECLYINNNQIHDFNQYINIIFRNSLVLTKGEKETNVHSDTCLYNLNMNEANCSNRNIEKIKLIKEGFDKTNLKCLDILSVLYGYNPRILGSQDYFDEIEKIIQDLQQKQDEYKKTFREILENEVDEKKYKRELGEGIKEVFKDLETNVDKIIKDSNAKYNPFIIEEAEKLRNSMFNYGNGEEEKIKFQKFIKYIQYRRVKKILEEKKKIINQKKMILI